MFEYCQAISKAVFAIFASSVLPCAKSACCNSKGCDGVAVFGRVYVRRWTRKSQIPNGHNGSIDAHRSGLSWNGPLASVNGMRYRPPVVLAVTQTSIENPLKVVITKALAVRPSLRVAQIVLTRQA